MGASDGRGGRELSTTLVDRLAVRGQLCKPRQPMHDAGNAFVGSVWLEQRTLPAFFFFFFSIYTRWPEQQVVTGTPASALLLISGEKRPKITALISCCLHHKLIEPQSATDPFGFASISSCSVSPYILFALLQSWYLMADMQLHWVSPLLLYPLWRWRRYGLIWLSVVLVASCAVPFTLTYVNNLPSPLPLTLRYGRTCVERLSLEPLPVLT